MPPIRSHTSAPVLVLSLQPQTDTEVCARLVSSGVNTLFHPSICQLVRLQIRGEGVWAFDSGQNGLSHKRTGRNRADKASFYSVFLFLWVDFLKILIECFKIRAYEYAWIFKLIKPTWWPLKMVLKKSAGILNFLFVPSHRVNSLSVNTHVWCLIWRMTFCVWGSVWVLAKAISSIRLARFGTLDRRINRCSLC